MELPVADALGLRAAHDVDLSAEPTGAVALAPGYAVASADLVGVDAYSPAWLTNLTRVEIGGTLPIGTDAVVPADAVVDGREVSLAVAPGTNVRRAGSDWPGGRVLRTGERVFARHVLAFDHVPVRQIRVALTACERAPRTAAWLAGELMRWGVTLGAPADLTLRFTAGPDEGGPGLTHHGLALAPGAGAGVGPGLVLVPARFDGAVAAVAALVLPALAVLGAWRLAGERHRLTAKLASAPGWSELALLRRLAGRWQPLAIGDAPLEAILATDGAAILPADGEGLAEGAELTALPWSAPFRRREMVP